jgi:hypothetical protein
MADDKSYLDPPQADEDKYQGIEDYDKQLKTRTELARMWAARITSADRTYKTWADRFRIEMLYQYYEGFQWFFETDENNRPYVINMVQSTIESKLPSLIFQEPQFSLRPRPVGLSYDADSASQRSQVKEDALNYVCSRQEFGIADKHELAVLDAFFGFGVIEVDTSDELAMNPYIPLKGKVDPLDTLYSKQIPFDTFRASATSNWDNSTGKWYGYFEFIPHSRLQKYKDKLRLEDKPYSDLDEVSITDSSTGKITVATDTNNVIGPPNTCKIWKLWDFETGKFCMYSPDGNAGDAILEYRDFNTSTLSFLRFGKRRKGWYPYPPVWNWVSPQDEINDTRQAQRLHRKRFTRKYQVMANALESEDELDKFLYGPDGTVIKVNRENAITPIADAEMDPVDVQSLSLAYDDFNRISQTPDEQRGVNVSSNRTTATQANIMNQQSQIKQAKDATRVAEFMCDIGRKILHALYKVKKNFWIEARLPNMDGPMMELKPIQKSWKQINGIALRDRDFDIDMTVTSMSPISAQQDKTSFMEFLAVITQYEILAFSPALIREAAYKTNYKNAAVLNQFQQMAQLASIGRLEQLKQQVAPISSPQGAQPGQLAQQQTDASTPPDLQQISNMIFNKQGVQPQ